VLLLLFTRNDILNNYGPLETARVEAVQKPFFDLNGNELLMPPFPFEAPPGTGSLPPP